MEMLIVVAIIAVLATIAIPVVSSSIHKSREAADLANVRSYYAYLQQDYLTTGDYLPGFDDDPWRNITDTINYPDGTSIKLKTGRISVYRPAVNMRDQQSGYMIHYFCDKGDTTYTFGATQGV